MYERLPNVKGVGVRGLASAGEELVSLGFGKSEFKSKVSYMGEG